MLILKEYKNNVEKAWYNSSNVIYSECEDKVNDFKELKIVFKNGSTYIYHKVDVKDYLLFRTSISQGKAINEYIKKYEFDKIELSDVNEINFELNKRLEEEKQK